MTPTPAEIVQLCIARASSHATQALDYIREARDAAATIPGILVPVRDAISLAFALNDFLLSLEKEPVVAKERAAAGNPTQP